MLSSSFKQIDQVKFKLVDPTTKKEHKFIADSPTTLSYWEVAVNHGIGNSPVYKKRQGKSFSIGRDRIDVKEGDIFKSIETVRAEQSARDQADIEASFQKHEQQRQQPPAGQGRVQFGENKVIEASDGIEQATDGDGVEPDEDYDEEGNGDEEEEEEEEYEEDDEEVDEEEEYYEECEEEDEDNEGDNAAAEGQDDDDEYELMTHVEAVTETRDNINSVQSAIVNRSQDLDRQVDVALSTGKCDLALTQSAEARFVQESLQSFKRSITQLRNMLQGFIENGAKNGDDNNVGIEEKAIVSLLVQGRELLRHYVPHSVETGTQSSDVSAPALDFEIEITQDVLSNTVALKRAHVQLRVVIDGLSVEIGSLRRELDIAVKEAPIVPKVNSKPDALPLPPSSEDSDMLTPLPQPGEGRVKQATRRFTIMATKAAQSAALALNPVMHKTNNRLYGMHNASALRGHEEFNGSLVFEKAKGLAKCSVGGIMLDLLPAKFDPEDPSKRPQGWHRIRLFKIQALEEADRSQGIAEEAIAGMRPEREIDVERQMIEESLPFRSIVAKFIQPKTTEPKNGKGSDTGTKGASPQRSTAGRRNSLVRTATLSLLQILSRVYYRRRSRHQSWRRSLCDAWSLVRVEQCFQLGFKHSFKRWIRPGQPGRLVG
jgi:hypothetical protein